MYSTKTVPSLLIPVLALGLACSDDIVAEQGETGDTGTDTTSQTGDEAGSDSTESSGDATTDPSGSDSDATTDPSGDGDSDATTDPSGDGDAGDGDGDGGGDGDGDGGGDGDGDPPAPLSLTQLQPIGVYESGIFDESAAEIVAHDPGSSRLFVGNSAQSVIDVLDFSDPTAPTPSAVLDVSAYGSPTSVAVHEGIVAVAVVAPLSTDPGTVVLFDAAELSELSAVRVGALPDMLTFSPDGSKLIVACEGEPDMLDPEASVAIIDVSGDLASLTDEAVSLATFEQFNIGNIDPQIRIFPGKSVAADVEPEYVAVSADSSTAWVSLQENNALAVVDLDSATVTQLIALGYKNHSLPGMGLDPSDADEAVQIANWPVFGMYMPDAIARFSIDGQDYLLSANEGDARSEDERVADLTLDPDVFPDATIQDDAQLGRLAVSTIDGDIDNDGAYERLYAYGARSMSVWAANGNLLWDSGDDFEQLTAAASPEHFNATNDDNDSFESRSDNKGPEPEGAVVAELWGKHYAFVGLERIGGIMVYDVSIPSAPEFVLYDNSTRDFTGVAEEGSAGDLGPEGLIVIDAADSPSQEPLLVVSNEVSGSVRIYQIIGE